MAENANDPLRKVQPGDPLALTAAWYNATVDAIRRGRRTPEANGPIATPRDGLVVLVRNNSGGDVDRYGVLAITAPIITPSDDEDEFQRRLAFEGSTPSGSTAAGKWVVLLEPLADGEIGRAVLAGLTVAKLSVPGSLGAFAEFDSGNNASLATGSTGSARILWAESSGTTRWAVVRLGDGSGSASATGVPAWLKFTVDHTDIAVAANTIAYEVYELAAGSVIHAAIIRPTESFDVAASARLGHAATTNSIVAATAINGTITGASFRASNLNSLSSADIYVRSFSSATPIILTVDSGGPDLDTSTTGSLDVYLLVSALPSPA